MASTVPASAGGSPIRPAGAMLFPIPWFLHLSAAFLCAVLKESATASSSTVAGTILSRTHLRTNSSSLRHMPRWTRPWRASIWRSLKRTKIPLPDATVPPFLWESMYPLIASRMKSDLLPMSCSQERVVSHPFSLAIQMKSYVVFKTVLQSRTLSDRPGGQGKRSPSVGHAVFRPCKEEKRPKPSLLLIVRCGGNR